MMKTILMDVQILLAFVANILYILNINVSFVKILLNIFISFLYKLHNLNLYIKKIILSGLTECFLYNTVTLQYAFHL